MDIIQEVFDLSKKILDTKPFHVTINNEGIEKLSKQMKIDGIPNFYDSEPEQKYKTGITLEILKELIASSINYCYWYGSHDIRPNNVSSASMYDHVNEVFDPAINQALNFEWRINKLIDILSINRYPMLEERKRHLYDLCENRKAESFCGQVQVHHVSGSTMLFEELVKQFHGFASDQFLKRASLFFIQLYRKFGWFKDTLMTHLFVPADYQVPKILRFYDCIRYSNELSHKIFDSKLIEKNSLEELQIRAATINVCTTLQYSVGWTIADVDTYLWTKRKLSDQPFHLTYTTDY